MEGGKPEDVSLLAGGADQPLIPVQGGGGLSGGSDHTKPWENYNENEKERLYTGFMKYHSNEQNKANLN